MKGTVKLANGQVLTDCEIAIRPIVPVRPTAICATNGHTDEDTLQELGRVGPPYLIACDRCYLLGDILLLSGQALKVVRTSSLEEFLDHYSHPYIAAPPPVAYYEVEVMD